MGGRNPGRASAYIRRELHDRLAAEARRRDVSIAYLLDRAVERALPGWEEQDLDALVATGPRHSAATGASSA